MIMYGVLMIVAALSFLLYCIFVGCPGDNGSMELHNGCILMIGFVVSILLIFGLTAGGIYLIWKGCH